MLLTFISMKKQTVCIGERDKPIKNVKNDANNI